MSSPIVRVDIYCVSLAYRTPIEWTIGGVETHAQYLIVRAWDRDGREGAAEAACRSTWNGTSPAGLARLFADVGWPLLSSSGFAPDHIGRIRGVNALTALLDNLTADFECDGATASAADTGPSVMVITRGDVAEMARSAEDAADRGFGAIKLKLGQGLETDEAVMAAARSAVGSSFVLCADANSAYGQADAEALMVIAQRYGLAFVEDPLALQPLAASFDRRPRSPVPMVVDRYCDSPLAARQFADLGQFDIAAKPSRVGSRAACEMIEAVAAHGGRAVIGLFGETGAGALSQIRLAAEIASGALWGIEASFHEALEHNLLRFEIAVADGRYVAPLTLHLARAIDWDRLEALSDTKTTLRI